MNTESPTLKLNLSLELVKASSIEKEYQRKDLALYGGAYDHDKTRLRTAFRSMRKSGLIALQNFTCCQSCGWCEIQERIDKHQEKKGELPQGCTFYHRQDADSRNDGYPFHLAYSHSGKSDEASPLPTQEVGIIICLALIQQKIPFTWDGEAHTRIQIHPIFMEEYA